MWLFVILGIGVIGVSAVRYGKALLASLPASNEDFQISMHEEGSE